MGLLVYRRKDLNSRSDATKAVVAARWWLDRDERRRVESRSQVPSPAPTNTQNPPMAGSVVVYSYTKRLTKLETATNPCG
jgi:hypothetical protein